MKGCDVALDHSAAQLHGYKSGVVRVRVELRVSVATAGYDDSLLCVLLGRQTSKYLRGLMAVVHGKEDGKT